MAMTASLLNTITRSNIYHRLEWYVDGSHDPNGNHTIDPSAKIEAFFDGYSPSEARQILYVSLRGICDDFVPAFQSMLLPVADGSPTTMPLSITTSPPLLSATATGASLVPVMVMVSAADEVAPRVSETV